jgi:hypothetical protein
MREQGKNQNDCRIIGKGGLLIKQKDENGTVIEINVDNNVIAKAVSEMKNMSNTSFRDYITTSEYHTMDEQSIYGPYCINCGACDKESGYDYTQRKMTSKPHTQGLPHMAIISITKTSRGHLCQYCNEFELIELNYSKNTGSATHEFYEERRPYADWQLVKNTYYTPIVQKNDTENSLTLSSADHTYTFAIQTLDSMVQCGKIHSYGIHLNDDRTIDLTWKGPSFT